MVPDGCIRCKTEEDNNIKSKRRNLIMRDGNTNPIIIQTIQGYIIASIAFGNTCNLKCIMCSRESSSRWRKEYRSLWC